MNDENSNAAEVNTATDVALVPGTPSLVDPIVTKTLDEIVAELAVTVAETRDLVDRIVRVGFGGNL